MAEHASGSRDVSKDMTRGDSKARRSSLAKDTGQSLTDLAQQKEFTKPTYLLEVLNPVLEAMALRYFEKDEMEQLQTSYEDTVKQYIAWIQETQNLPPPPEYDSDEPSKEELQRLRDSISELKRKLADIEKIEDAAKPSDKMKSTVRRVSAARRVSKLLSAGAAAG
ncbi:unnamed protein product [Amoebophrya sp. A120]|nr:unnamed protein product [Amoebophrya sp. A120]|eukprot:GSA120T00012549001.1